MQHFPKTQANQLLNQQWTHLSGDIFSQFLSKWRNIHCRNGGQMRVYDPLPPAWARPTQRSRPGRGPPGCLADGFSVDLWPWWDRGGGIKRRRWLPAEPALIRRPLIRIKDEKGARRRSGSRSTHRWHNSPISVLIGFVPFGLNPPIGSYRASSKTHRPILGCDSLFLLLLDQRKVGPVERERKNRQRPDTGLGSFPCYKFKFVGKEGQLICCHGLGNCRFRLSLSAPVCS